MKNQLKEDLNDFLKEKEEGGFSLHI